MWDILKNPKKQIVIIIVLLVGFWSYDITISDKHIPISTESDVVQDTVVVETIPEVWQQQQMMLPPPDSSSSNVERGESIDESTLNQEYEFKIQFWDMILGHLVSIVGSLAALLTPLITVYLNKKGYLNPSENVEQ